MARLKRFLLAITGNMQRNFCIKAG